MNGRVLLDTNIVVGLINGDPRIRAFIAQSEQSFVPSIVAGELFYGALGSSRVAENVARVNAFVSGRSVLDCDEVTAWHYGNLKNQLRVKGRPIPENDIWIAAVAIQHDLTLVSRDGHFSEIERLKLESLSP